MHTPRLLFVLLVTCLSLIGVPPIAHGQSTAKSNNDILLEQLHDERQRQERLLEQQQELSERFQRDYDELEKRQQTALESMSMFSADGVENKLARIENRLRLLEQGRVQSRKLQEQLKATEAARADLQLTDLQTQLFTALLATEQLYTDSRELVNLMDWSGLVAPYRELADPTTYNGFVVSYTALQEEQKKSLQLPNVGILDDAYTAAIYTYANVVGTKQEPAQKTHVLRINCLLEVARRAEGRLDQVGTEFGFAQESLTAVHERATTLQEELFDLVRLQPGTNMDMAHFSYFKQNVQPEFLEEERPAIEEQLRNLLALRQEYQFQLRYLQASLQKAIYALDHPNADCGGEGAADDVVNEYTERTAALREALGGALVTIRERYAGGLTRYAIDRPILPEMSGALLQTK